MARRYSVGEGGRTGPVDRCAPGVRRTDIQPLEGGPVKTIIILVVVVLVVLFLLGKFRPGKRL
jgi:hypothetical protein